MNPCCKRFHHIDELKRIVMTKNEGGAWPKGSDIMRSWTTQELGSCTAGIEVEYLVQYRCPICDHIFTTKELMSLGMFDYK